VAFWQRLDVENGISLPACLRGTVSRSYRVAESLTTADEILRSLPP
jgi:hypothetical protein